MVEPSNKSTCKTHGQPVQMICLSCKKLMCLKCLGPHVETKCAGGVLDLPSYAKENLVPRFERMLKDLEANRGKLEGSTKVFAGALPEIRKGLRALKERIEKLLLGVNSAIAATEGYGPDDSPYSVMKAALERQLTELKTDVATNRTIHIVECMESHNELQANISAAAVGAGDAELRLAEATNSVMARLLGAKEFETLGECLQGLIATCRNVFKRKAAPEVVTSRFVYGICDPLGGSNRLCKYDVTTRKVVGIIPVPYSCSVLQMRNRIFISGGENPVVNTVSEFVEATGHLVRKASMKHAKYLHSVIAVSESQFVAIGGYNKTGNLAYCEEYDIQRNAWKMLPSLNRARYSAGTALSVDFRYLYAIGGREANDIIERLDMNEKARWTEIALSSAAEIPLSSDSAAFSISADEIMIFVGCKGANCAIYNVKAGTIKKHSQSFITSENYYFNSLCIIDSNVYVIGATSGNLHIYKTAEKRIAEIDYHDASA